MTTTLLPARIEPEHFEPTEPPDRSTSPWLLVLVPAAAWVFIKALRTVEGRPTRSTIANDLLRRALSTEVLLHPGGSAVSSRGGCPMGGDVDFDFPLAFRPSPEVLAGLRRAAVASGIDPDDDRALGVFAGDLIAGAVPGAVEDRLSDDRLSPEVTP